MQSTHKQFNKFIGFNDDKYIINVSGYESDWYDYKIGWVENEIRFDISIFNADNFNELLEENYNDYLECCKISDNLFKFVYQKGSFYYNEKDNKIEYIDNIFNYIRKPFGQTCQNKNKKKNLYSSNEDDEIYSEKKNKEYRYFYLNDDMFAVFDEKYYLYIINLSAENKIVKRIELKWLKDDKYTDLDIKDIIYYTSDKEEYLLFLLMAKDKKTGKKINQIINGIIL